MHQYIIDTEFAATNLLQLATAEEKELKEQTERLTGVEAQLRVRTWDFESSEFNDDCSDAYVMGAFGRMANAAQEAQALDKQLASLQASVGTHQHATQVIAGAILQIAKQGISVVHGGPKTAPEGRKIGTVPVRDVLWQARNQALHYEEGTFSKAVTDLFGTLEKEQGSLFSLTKHAKQSRAKQILGLLDWTSYASYLQDMRSLLP
jgi:hypothetical protein